MKSTKKGFSLVELLVVVTIMAILSVTAYIAIGGQTISARDAKRLQDIDAIQSALELFYVANSAYPDDTAELNDTYFRGDRPMDNWWEANYPYEAAADNQSYALGAWLEEGGTPTLHEVGSFGGHVGWPVPSRAP